MNRYAGLIVNGFGSGTGGRPVSVLLTVPNTRPISAERGHSFLQNSLDEIEEDSPDGEGRGINEAVSRVRSNLPPGVSLDKLGDYFTETPEDEVAKYLIGLGIRGNAHPTLAAHMGIELPRERPGRVHR
jgi:hypothetical protein